MSEVSKPIAITQVAHRPWAFQQPTAWLEIVSSSLRQFGRGARIPALMPARTEGWALKSAVEKVILRAERSARGTGCAWNTLRRFRAAQETLNSVERFCQTAWALEGLVLDMVFAR